MKATIKDFLRMESAGGILLMAAALLAILVANTPLSVYYELFVDTPVEIRIGVLEIGKPLLLWVNDGLMAIFFFLVGLELKRELLEGELSRPAGVLLPAFGAIGGVLVPVGIYAALNAGDPVAIQGWAIPAATDIAFAMGILMLLGSRVPLALKVFLVSLAIFDDLGAILIIAIFYSVDLSVQALAIAAACLLVLTVMNRGGVGSVTPYVFVGIVMWVAVLKSGVHATLAGVALAGFIPMRDPADQARSPLCELEHDLHRTVAFGVLPLFAFCNAGISFTGMQLNDLMHPVSLGIAAGLFLGKQIGIFAACFLAIKTGLASLPQGTGWGALYGAATLCGVGFTMSLFIGGLAFEHNAATAEILFDERLGILLGSALSGLVGYVILQRTLPRAQ